MGGGDTALPSSWPVPTLEIESQPFSRHGGLKPKLPKAGSTCYAAFVVRAPEDHRRLGVGSAGVSVMRAPQLGTATSTVQFTAGGLQCSEQVHLILLGKAQHTQQTGLQLVAWHS